MTKARDVTDKSVRDQKGRPEHQPADKSRPDILEGKSFQVNENSVEEGEPVDESTPPVRHKEKHPEKRPDEKIEGKAFQVNDKSVKN